jgi:uncharacterized membrane protein YhfC
MYYLLYTLNALLMLVPAVLLGRYIARTRKIGWSVFLAGAFTFILSQVGHLPFNAVVVPLIQDSVGLWSKTAAVITLSLFLGLSAGVFEEVARYLTFRFWRKDVRTWGGGMMLGAGHGGFEAIIVGLIFSINFFLLSAYDAGYLPNLLANVSMEDLPAAKTAVQLQIDTLFTLPWYGTILGGIERLFAVTLHLSLSLMVMQTFIRGQKRWLLLAIGWHALADAGAVMIIGLVNQPENGYIAEGFLALIALGGLLIIRYFKQPEPVEPEPEPLPPLKSITPFEVEVTRDNLDRSRYV